VKKFFRYLAAHDTLLIIVNTAFWLGLGYLLLSSQVRLVVGGAVLALLLGGYLLYVGLFPKSTRGMAQPALAHWQSASMGLLAVALGSGLLLWFFSGGVPTRRQVLEQRLAAGGIMLDLSGLGLREVPPAVWSRTDLLELDLSRNRLKVLPPEIGRLTQLERLYLNDNRLESLPPEIGQLAQLTWLELDGNRLTTLPPELARLHRLTHLKVQYNRLTTFPDVVLELPALELLWLSGNDLGPLPAVLTERAAAGTLNLWYRPRASRVDGASLLVIVLTGVGPWLASWFLTRRWAAWEQAARQVAQQEGIVFAIPSLARAMMLWVLLTLGAVCLFFTMVALASQGDVSVGNSLVLWLVLSPVMAACLYLLLHYTGLVILTPEAVVMRRLGREKRLRYADITAVRELAWGIPPNLVLKGAGQTLRIPRTVEHLPALYAQLLERIPPAVRESLLGPPPGAEVYRFAIRRRARAWYGVGTVLFILLYLGIGLMGVWIPLGRGDVPPLTWRWARDAGLTFLLVSTLFLPALVFIVRSFFTAYGPFEIPQPSAWEWHSGEIRYRFPRGAWQTRPARDLQRVVLESEPVKVRARAAGALIEERVMVYRIVLVFVDGEQLTIDQERAVQLGESPERLYQLLKRLYNK
jgi:hypothetical protein